MNLYILIISVVRPAGTRNPPEIRGCGCGCKNAPAGLLAGGFFQSRGFACGRVFAKPAPTGAIPTSDPSVSDDAFLPGRSSFTKQVGFDMLHKTATKICVTSPERRSALGRVLRPPMARKTGSLLGPCCNCISVQGCSCIF